MSGVSFKVSADTAQVDAKLDAITRSLTQIKNAANLKVSADATAANLQLASVNKNLNQIKESTQSVASSISGAFKGIGAALGITAIAVGLKGLSDSAIMLENRMKTIATSSREVELSIRNVRDLSIETRSAVGSTAELFQKYSKAAQQIGASSSDILAVTRLTAQSIQLSGTAAESANAAIIQLGQGLSSGVLRGEELNSVLEQAPRLAQAIADGLGVGIGQLRSLGAQGQLTSQQVFSSLLSQADQLNAEFERTTLTMANQITNLKTATSVFGSEALKGLTTGALGDLVGKLSSVIYVRSDTIQSEVSGFASRLRLRVGEVVGVAGAVANVGKALYSSFKDALPVITQSRTLIGDVFGFISNAAAALKEILVAPFVAMLRAARDASIFLRTGFGVFDFEVPKSIRAAFDAKNLVEFKQALNALAKGIDGNTSFILNRLKALPRQLKYDAQDILSYFGLFEKSTFRFGYFEPFLNTMSELKTGLKDNLEWTATASAGFGNIGKAISAIGPFISDLTSIFKAGGLIVGGALASLSTAVVGAVSKLAEASRSFTENNTFKDVFESAKSHLTNALEMIAAFGKAVIRVFFEIWDAVIGHSWWTDTVETIVSTSDSLWDRAASGLNRFARNTKDLFRGIYDDRASTRILDNGKALITDLVTEVRFRVSKVDFLELGSKIKDALIEAFSNLKDNYKDILESAGIAALFLGFVSLFPGNIIAQAISAKAILAITLGLAVTSDRLVSQISGRSPLGVIAATMGEVLGRELFRFMSSIPEILNSALAIVVGLFKGFVSELPGIGPLLKRFLNFDVTGDILGLVGVALFGKTLLSILNALGLVKIKAAGVMSAISRTFSVTGATMLTASGGQGLIMRALFGPSEIAILGTVLLFQGAFDSILGDSVIAKAIASGGLIWMFLYGLDQKKFGRALGSLLQNTKAFTQFVTGLLGGLSSIMTGLFSFPVGPGVVLSKWQTFVVAIRSSWKTLMTWMVTTANSSTWGAAIVSQFTKIGVALGVLKTQLFAFAATGPGKFLMNKWTLGAVVLGGGMLYAGTAKADTLGGPSQPEDKGLAERLGDTIKGAFNSVVGFIEENLTAIFIGGVFLKAVGPAIITAISTALTTAAAAAGVTVLALIGSVLLPFALPIAIIAGITAAVVAIGNSWGDGNTVAERLSDSALKLMRAFGQAPRYITPDTKAKLEAPFSKTAQRFTEGVGFKYTGIASPTAQDYSSIDLTKASSSSLKNQKNYAEAYNNALEQGAKELLAGGVTSNTWKEIETQSKKYAKAIEALRTATSDIDPKEAIDSFLNAVPIEKNMISKFFSEAAASSSLKAAKYGLDSLRATTGFSSSTQAIDIGKRLEPLEIEREKIEAGLKSRPLDLQLFEALVKVNAAISAVQKDATNFSGSKDKAFSSAEALRAMEKVFAGAERDYANAGRTVNYSDDIKRLALLGGGARTGASEVTAREVSAIFERVTEAQKQVSRPETLFRQISPLERQEDLTLLMSAMDDAFVRLPQLIATNFKELVNRNYKERGDSLQKQATAEDVKLSPEAASGMKPKQLEEVASWLSQLKLANTLLAEASTTEETSFAARLAAATKLKIEKAGEVAEIISLKGHLAGLAEISKSTNTNKLFDIVGARLTNTQAKELLVNQEKLRKLAAATEADALKAREDAILAASTSPGVRPKNAEEIGDKGEEAFRAQRKKDLKALQDVVDGELTALMTPKQKAIADAERLGVVLGAAILKGLDTVKGVEFVTKKLLSVETAQNAVLALPAGAPVAEAVKVDTALSKAVRSANKSFEDGPKAKTLSEMFSGALGINFEDLRLFDQASFTTSVSLAKSLSKIEDSISKLSATASKSTVDKLLKARFEVIKQAAEQTAKYAYSTVEKIGVAFSSLGLSDIAATPALQALAIMFDKVSVKMKTQAKEPGSLLDYEAYSKTEQTLRKIQEALKNVTANTFGDKLERVNSQLKLNFTEKSFNSLSGEFKGRLDRFAQYYQQSLSKIRSGEIAGDTATTLLQKLETGLKSVKFIALFEGFGETIANALGGGAKTQFAALKDIDISEKAFKVASSDARGTATETSLLLEQIGRVTEDPSTSASMLSRITEALREGFSLPGLRGLVDELKAMGAKDVINIDERLLETVETLTAQIKVLGEKIEAFGRGGAVKKSATGGSVWGEGSATSDSIPAMLSNREFVVNAAAADKDRPLLDKMNSGSLNLAGGSSAASSYTAMTPDSSATAKGLSDTKTVIGQQLQDAAKAASAMLRATLPLAEKLSEAARIKDVTVSSASLAGLTPNRLAEFEKLVSNVPFKELASAKEYGAALEPLEAFIAKYLTYVKDMGKAAGEAFSQTTQQSLAGMLKNSLSGKENGLSFEGVIGMFAESITNTVADSFMKNLVKPGGVIGNALESFGESLYTSVAGLFSKSAGGGDWLGTAFKAVSGFFGGGFAAGGFVSGAGTGTSDSIPAMLSDGEFVVNAAATKEYASLLKRINSGNMPKFAQGGLVGTVPMESGAILSEVANPVNRKESKSQVFNINVTGDISMQTRREIQQMIPQIATGVNTHNYERGSRR